MLALASLYTLWLASSIWGHKPHAEKKRRLSSTTTVFAGAVLQLVNVKGILYGLTAMSSFVLPYYRELPAVALFSLMLATVGFLCTLLWALCGSVFERFFKKYSKLVNGVMALLLVWCAYSMLSGLWS